MSAFSVATFNLYNLVKAETPYYGNRRYSTEQFNRKVAWVAGQLDSMDADIVGFQEVFHTEALEACRHATQKYGTAAVLELDLT